MVNKKQKLNIIQLRQKKGLQQKELAKLLTGKDGKPIQSGTLGRIERGERVLYPELAIHIAKVLDCSISEILGEIELTSTSLSLIEILGVQTSDGIVMEKTGSKIAKPDILKNVASAFAIEVFDETMNPKFSLGEVVFADPTRVVKINDYVVAVSKNNVMTVRKINALTKTTVKLEQLNKKKIVTHKTKDVKLNVIVASQISR